ncbi:protein PFC0760c [Bombus terrestris]|uniref:Death domain-associated protein 6 n=1 Tax=Bombus terrestris TaxID=30195 RepID=A0A9B2MQK6_BOMTE|nr:protein PFC0760c [Bombus terrestris]XP_012167276.1 protein PFC0760c [Bombus terrestris]
MVSKENDIICISSDDDEDARQNKTDDTQGSVIKLVKDNHNSHSNFLITTIRVEASLCDNDGVKRRKRKASEIENVDSSCIDKNSEVFLYKQEANVKACNLKKEDETEKGREENKILLKPQLVVKEKKTISSMEQDIFSMFISLCLQKDRSDDMKKIVNKLKRRYEQLDPVYAHSEAFNNFLNRKRNDIMESNCKLYIYIAEVMNEMKNCCKGKSTLLSNRDYFSDVNKTNRDCKLNNSNASTGMCSNMTQTSNSIINDNGMMLTNADNGEEQKKELATEKKIKKILNAMKKCEKYIKRFEELEVDFDDEENSNYIKLEKYKHRMVELYNKYCEYTGENIDAGRQYLRPKDFSTTSIVVVNNAITNFINSKISKRNKLKKIGDFTRALIFPDYNDILQCVTRCNDMNNLGLNNKKLREIAKKAFIDLGEHLQRCRRNDYWDTFSLFLENKEDDPALKDMELAEKLMQNKRISEKKLSDTFEEYVKKQEEMKDQITHPKRSENEEDDDDSIENNDAEEEDDDDNDEADDNDISDIDVNLSSSSEDENSTDISETSKNKTNTEAKSNTGKANSDIEMGEIDQQEINDRLKDHKGDNLKSRKVNDFVNTSNYKNNFKSESIIQNDAISAPNVTKHLNITTNIAFSTTTDNKILIDRTKEDDPNIISENPMDDKSLEDKAEEAEEAEEKPLLRVRSFAKPPITWKDGQEKVGESNESEDTLKTLTAKNVIDLTQDITQENSVRTIQVIPIVKGNCKTFVIPTGKSIINVKNITNNYVKLNTKNMDSRNVTKLGSSQIISSPQAIDKNTKFTSINNISSNLVNQETNINQIQNSQMKQKSTSSMLQSNQMIVLPMKQKENTLQRPKTFSSTSQSK